MLGCLYLCPNYRIVFFLFNQDLRVKTMVLEIMASQNHILHMSCENIWCFVPKIRFHQIDIKMSAGCVQNLKAIGLSSSAFNFCPDPVQSSSEILYFGRILNLFVLRGALSLVRLLG